MPSPYGRPWRRRKATILARDRYRCHWCGGRATTVDHVHPRAEGGTDDPRNLVASCVPCNLRRGGKLGARRASPPSLAPRRVWVGAIDPRR
jgi:5-methylcytosine-specific restriction endonuclease McrA